MGWLPSISLLSLNTKAASTLAMKGSTEEEHFERGFVSLKGKVEARP
jgi:hypothetical protein